MSARLFVVLFGLGGCGRLEFAPVVDAPLFPDVDAVPGCSARSVAISEAHTCIGLENGNVYCTGDNSMGQLGLGVVTAQVDTPVLVSRFTGAASVHTGQGFSAIVDGAGGVRCVGANANSQCGVTGAMVLEPAAPTGLPPVAEMSAGYSFACARVQSDTYCWGDTDEGQGGTGSVEGDHDPEPVPMLAGMNAVVSAGSRHACAVLPGGAVACWGDGRNLRLGAVPPDICPGATAGSIMCATQPMMISVVPMTAVSAGDEHTCALATGGEVWCWGANDEGQVGVAPSTEEPPTRLATNDLFQQLAASRNHTCALDTEGRVLCWGANALQQLGSAGPGRFTPVVVPLPAKATAVHSGESAYHACATIEDGSVWCWGASASGQLGRGPQTEPGAPAPVVVACP